MIFPQPPLGDFRTAFVTSSDDTGENRPVFFVTWQHSRGMLCEFGLHGHGSWLQGVLSGWTWIKLW